jgi:putative membrane protein
MSRSFYQIFWILTLFTIASCDDDKGDTNSVVAEADREFVMNAADEGLFQISAGQVALNNGASKRYADFGQLMIDGYTASNRELQDYAASKNLNVRTTLSDTRQQTLDTLSGRKGMELDTVYAAAMLVAHSNTITYFETQKETVTDAQLRTWIEKKLPTLRQYLEQAKVLNDTLQ